MVLKKIESPEMGKKSKSVAAFRVRESMSGGHNRNNDKIVVEFKNNNKGKKRNVSMPGAQEKMVI